MASSLNRVLLMGHITRDIELKHTSANTAVTTVGLAMNRRWRTPEGEQREEVTFVDCEAWGTCAELIAQYFAKGRPIMIEGRLKLESWEDRETGDKRQRLKVVIEEFYFVDSKPAEGEQRSSSSSNNRNNIGRNSRTTVRSGSR